MRTPYQADDEIRRLERDKLELSRVCLDYIGELQYFRERLTRKIDRGMPEEEREKRIERTEIKINEITRVLIQFGYPPNISV